MARKPVFRFKYPQEGGDSGMKETILRLLDVVPDLSAEEVAKIFLITVEEAAQIIEEA